MQDQYAFIHDAVLETLICGDTHIPSSDLLQALDKLKKVDKHTAGMTGLEKQFQVSSVLYIMLNKQNNGSVYSLDWTTGPGLICLTSNFIMSKGSLPVRHNLCSVLFLPLEVQTKIIGHSL